jgi:hypothetical protein
VLLGASNSAGDDMSGPSGDGRALAVTLLKRIERLNKTYR